MSRALFGGSRDIIFYSQGGPSSIVYFYFWGMNKKLLSCDGRGGAQRPVLLVYEPKKAGAPNLLVEDTRSKSDVFVSFVKVSKVKMKRGKSTDGTQY